jgi:uncharacterized protein (DUF2252 family)
MSMDPFAFLRGAAAVMAADLSRLPSSGISVQLCGDAHLSNFGMFASVERSLVFDINDFDETLPGPFDWDVKRLAASIAVSAIVSGMRDKDARKAARAAVLHYAQTMEELSEQPTVDVWNARLDVDSLARGLTKTTLRKAAAKASAKSTRSTSETVLLKLTERTERGRRFLNQPPILTRIPDADRDDVIERLSGLYEQYLRTLQADRIALLSKFGFVDVAHKVVGVGSVGTRALVLLLESGDGEPLVLGASAFDNHGKRVVVGQRVMQATGDPFLGWAHGSERAQGDFYLRQLKDRKASIEVAALDREGLIAYGRLCGAVLARAHARAGDAALVSGYVGDGAEFSAAIAQFAMVYAQITQSDHSRLVAARRDG